MVLEREDLNNHTELPITVFAIKWMCSSNLWFTKKKMPKSSSLLASLSQQDHPTSKMQHYE